MADAREEWSALLEGLKRGESLAIAKASKVVTGVLMKLGAYDVRDAWDDVRQEVLIALVRSAREGKLRDAGSFVAYARTITRHRLSDQLRKDRSSHPEQRGEEAAHTAARRFHPEPGRRDPDMLVDLERALDSLPEKQRIVIQAIYLEGRSYEESAQRLGMPLGTLKRMQSDGLRQLRAAMEVER